jgi:hypothetical protein
MAVGLVAVGCYVVVPQDNVRMDADHNSGKYEIQATPGFGYLYRWDEDGDGEYDTEGFTKKSKVKFSLKPNSSRTVKLEVENAFGHVNAEEFNIVRPALDLSKGGKTLVLEQGADGQLRARGNADSLPADHPGHMKKVDGKKKRAPNLDDVQKTLKKMQDKGAQQ